MLNQDMEGVLLSLPRFSLMARRNRLFICRAMNSLFFQDGNERLEVASFIPRLAELVSASGDDGSDGNDGNDGDDAAKEVSARGDRPGTFPQPDLLSSEAPVDKSRTLLHRWCSPGYGYLRTYFDEEAVEWVEPVPDIKDFFNNLEQLTPQVRQHSGASTRLERFLDESHDLASKVSEVPQERIARLEKEISFLMQELEQARNGIFRVADANETRQWLSMMEEDAKRLMSDLEDVNEGYIRIFREMVKRELDDDSSRGALVHKGLQQADLLEQTPQGRSFQQFWTRFLSDWSIMFIREQLDQVKRAVRKRRIDWDWTYLNSFAERLHAKATATLATGNRLVSRLLSIYKAYETGTGRLVLNELKALKRLSLEIPYRETGAQALTTIHHVPMFDLQTLGGMTRKLVMPGDEAKGPMVSSMTPFEPLEDEQVAFNRREVVTARELYQRIVSRRAEGRDFTLAELMEQWPLQDGLNEFLGYLEALQYDENWKWDESVQDLVSYGKDDGTTMQWSIPRMIINAEY